MTEKNAPTQDKANQYTRKIRSFVLRLGRLTPNQEKAIEELWPKFGLDPYVPLNMLDTFGNDKPVVFEIGFGNGESLAEMAQAQPDKNFIGIEVHTPGVGHLLIEIKQRGLTNIRIYNHDAVEVLEKAIPDTSLSAVQLFFPDPWHKKRHHKRRIVKTEFADLLHKKMAENGIWHIATDWEDYAHHCLDVLTPYAGFDNLSKEGAFVPKPDSRPTTKFERRGHRLGHGVWDLIFKKV